MNKRSKGFSLIELLIYISILSIIVIVTTTIFASLNRGRGQSEANGEVNSNLRFAIEKISQDIRSSSSVTTPASASSTSSSLILVAGGNTITYDVSGGQLRRQMNADQPDIITSGLVEVNTTNEPILFTRMENTNAIFSPPKKIISIEIFMNIRYKSASPDMQYKESKRTTISLR